MRLSTHHRLTAHRLALDILDGFPVEPAVFGQRMIIPSPGGAFRHRPGMPLHIMPEFLVVADGVNRIEFPAQTVDVQGGHICLIPKGLPHRETFVRSRNRFRMLVLMLRPERIHFHIVDLSPDAPPAELRFGISSTCDTGKIAQMAETVMRLRHASGDHQRFSADALALGQMAWIGEIMSSDPGARFSHSTKVSRALHLISKHLEDPRLGTATLALRIPCAADYLSNRFHLETGMTPLQYIHQERMRKAAHLLSHSSMIVKEVAVACGFDTPNYFSRLFRRATGMSPRQYRRVAQSAT